MSKNKVKTQKPFPKFDYEKEDDVLNIWLSRKRIDYAEQSGDVIVHFSKRNEPVYIEILDASSFLRAQSKVLPRELREAVFA